MSDPTNPMKIGELEVPGFSNYLRPIGENLTLSVGQQADEDTGPIPGLQVSLFVGSTFYDP